MTHHEGWKSNVNAKCSAVEGAIYDAFNNIKQCTNNTHRQSFLTACDRLIAKAEGLGGLFEPVPDLVKGVISDAYNLKSDPAHQSIISLSHALKSLKKLVNEDEYRNKAFNDLFESYKNDGKIKNFIEEVIRALKQIIEEGDADLSFQAARDLSEILNQLEYQKSRSLVEVNAWLGILVNTGAFIIDQLTGKTLATSLAQLLVLSCQTRAQIREAREKAFDDYKKQFRLNIDQRTPRSLRAKLEEISSDDLRKLLDDPKEIKLLKDATD